MLRFSLIVCLAASALGQETPTEREAARGVLRKMAALEQSLDLEKLTARVTAANPERDVVIARVKELMASELLAMGDELTRDPEIGFQEARAVKRLTAYLAQHGFEVETGVADLKTAFTARYKRKIAGLQTTGPHLGVILEYDALRGTVRPFHGDQHSAQGPVGMAAGIAMAEYLDKEKLPGSVTLFGTPGEEMMPPAAKTQMFEAGVFRGMDLIVRSHSQVATSRPAAGFGTCCLNIDGVRYTFSGAPAHQMTPWNGRNALEAVIQLFNNIDAIRSSLRPEARVQGVITEGGSAPNVVPDRAVADFYVRYPDEVYLRQVRQFVDDAARAAALATQTKVKIDHYGRLRDGISLGTLAEPGFGFAKQFGATNIQTEKGKPSGFEETGSISSVIPGLSVSAQSSTFANHTYEMETDALGTVGHNGFLVDAETMAAVLFSFATLPEYRAAVAREFAGLRALMGEYQSSLETVYTVPKVAEPK
jgi:amidohydrolase